MALSYPLNVSSYDTYMVFVRKKNNGFKTKELRSIDAKFKNIDTTSTNAIALPVPNGLSDSSSISYSDSTDNSLLESAVMNLANKTGLVDKASSLAASVSATGKVNQQTVIFSGVGIKQHSFSWNLIPESAQEANDIISIVREFEEAKLPYYLESNNSFWNFPDIFAIKFKGIQPKLYRFLPCVLTGISTNVGDFWQIYKDGNFPEINLSLTFSEIASRTRDIEQGLFK